YYSISPTLIRWFGGRNWFKTFWKGKLDGMVKRLNQKVCPVNFPPNKENSLSERAYVRSIEDMMDAVSSHLKSLVTAIAIKKADKTVKKAQEAIRRFNEVCSLYGDSISSEAVLLVLNSYYYANDLDIWTERLYTLTRAIEQKGRSTKAASGLPKVLVMGSPILFPVYKVPDLIAHCGLSIFHYVDSSSLSRDLYLTESEAGLSSAALIRAIARKQYYYDASSAYVTNESMEKLVRELVDEGKIEGVVCHILKGHIEYDFELNRMEAFFDEADIPVFRLETDYQYQDLEQLRIRLEAFGEMLNQRKIVRGRTGAVASKRRMHYFMDEKDAKRSASA
ncbi:MAG: 2-hydroxyacyl-CoA dehydratase, partial [Spirochaetales bacterium]|nr:2-hydroxyacyl-CoA dehydratase [Spirochaetales bacterium]